MMMNKIKENSLDICVVTETWLNNLYDIWLEGSEFNYNSYSVLNVNKNRLDYLFTIKLKASANKDTFEYAIWEPKIKTDILNIFAVYRPPYSQRHQRKIPQFIDEFLETQSDEISSLENVIVLGDFKFL